MIILGIIGFTVATALIAIIYGAITTTKKFKSLSDEEKKKAFEKYVIKGERDTEFAGVNYVRLCKDIFTAEEKRNHIRQTIKSDKGCKLMIDYADCWINQWAREVFTDAEWAKIKSVAIEDYRKRVTKEVEAQLMRLAMPSVSCPSCHMSTNRDKWILDSSEIKTETKFDSAYTLGGSTTIFTKNQKTVANTYRCPNCGYKITM